MGGSVTTVRSLHLIQRNPGSHRIEMFMVFDNCQEESIVHLWPRRARKEETTDSLSTGGGCRERKEKF